VGQARLVIGVVARADNRGLGHLTWEACRALQPDRVLVVVPSDGRARGFEQHVERYPGAVVVEWANGVLDRDTVADFLIGLDAVYLAETPYDDRFLRWARVAGVRATLHAMPEFWRPEWDVEQVHVWNPTRWRHDTLPARAEVVGVPVPLDRWPDPAPHRDGPATFVHIAGHRTAGDRNGTITLLRALRFTRQPMRLRVFAQGSFPRVRAPANVELDVVRDGSHDYWRAYDDADALVLPRRYGGLSLPVQEAAGAGLALVLSDVEPNSMWPSVRVTAHGRGHVRAPGGDVRSHETDPRRLAMALDRLSTDVELRHAQQHAARAWAGAHSWAVVLDEFRARLCG
jgi:glycosyltransferase involved in cell wall biosynthesis